MDKRKLKSLYVGDVFLIKTSKYIPKSNANIKIFPI